VARVFVSSRFDEFATLRRALSRGVATTSSVEIVNLDDGKAAPMGAVERSISSLNESDVVVLLCGETYADWDEPEYVVGSEPEKLSTTHLEFRAATDAGVPVLAFRTVSESRDARLETMLGEVGEAWVLGTLLEDTYDNVDRILDQLEDWANNADEAALPEGASSFAGQVMQELRFLGVENLDKWTLPESRARQEPAYVRLIEQRRFALTSLSVGEVEAARSQLLEAHSIYSLDWATDYLLARLLEVNNIKQDQSAARDLARKAAVRVADQDHAPMSLKNGTWDAVKDRREVATLTLQARLARRSLDLEVGAGFVDQALKRSPTSREALVERVRLNALARDIEKTKDAARDLLKIYPDRAATLMRSEDLASVQPDVEQSLIDFVLERREAALRALRVQVPRMTRPTRLRKALDVFRGAHDHARCDLAQATDAVLALTELGEGARVVPTIENEAAKLKASEKDIYELQDQFKRTKGIIESLSATNEPRECLGWVDDWDRSMVRHPPWADKAILDLRHVKAMRANSRGLVSHLFLQLRQSDAWPRHPSAWVVKEQAEAAAKHEAGLRKRDRLLTSSSKRVWWARIVLASMPICWFASKLAETNYNGNLFIYWPAFLTASMAGLAGLLAVLLFLVDPTFSTSARKLASHRQSLESLDARISTLGQLKKALENEKSFAVMEAVMAAELGPRREELLDDLAVYREKIGRELEESSQLVREARESLEKALETHARTTMTLGLDNAVAFKDVAADLLERYIRYDRAFAVFPSLTSRAYVPPRRAETGDLTRIAEGDLVQAQGGFLTQAADVPRRLVRKSGPGLVSDVGAVLDYPTDEIDAFELCLSEFVNLPVSAGHAAQALKSQV